MRVALIHHWQASGDVSDRVWNALCRVWPDADRFTSTDRMCGVTQWTSATPRRLQLLNQTASRVSQSLAAKPLEGDDGLFRLAGYDLILSSSLAAAEAVSNDSGSLHGCFISTETAATFCQEPAPAAMAGASRFESVREGAVANSTVARRPRIWLRDDAELPSAQAGVTHFLATTHAAAAQYHFDIAGQPHVVLYPPVDTTFFRPGPEAHETFYLLVCHPGVPVNLRLVIDSCQAARRDLVILGGESQRETVGSIPDNVRWEALPSDSILRSYYRRCRALLSAAPTGFDPSLVEAQACGTPVIAYHGAATEELMLDAEQSGLGTGLFFHTLDVDSLCSTMVELERRPQNVSAVLSLAQAEKFSPAHFEHSLANHLNRWLSSRAALKAVATASIPLPPESRLVPQRRAA